MVYTKRPSPAEQTQRTGKAFTLQMEKPLRRADAIGGQLTRRAKAGRVEEADAAARISEQAERNMGNAQAHGEAIQVVSAGTDTRRTGD
jgi:hypothetical protein